MTAAPSRKIAFRGRAVETLPFFGSPAVRFHPDPRLCVPASRLHCPYRKGPLLWSLHGYVAHSVPAAFSRRSLGRLPLKGLIFLGILLRTSTTDVSGFV